MYQGSELSFRLAANSLFILGDNPAWGVYYSYSYDLMIAAAKHVNLSTLFPGEIWMSKDDAVGIVSGYAKYTGLTEDKLQLITNMFNRFG